MSDERFSVDGTIIKAAASVKGFRRRNDDDDTDDSSNGAVHAENCSGEKLRDETHESMTDPEARLMGEGKESKLAFMARASMDNNGHGIVSDFRLTKANGMDERDAALES